MRVRLKRYYGHGDLHFITFSCYRREPRLAAPAARDCFPSIFEQVRQKYDFVIAGYVVMPEHDHLLISEPASGDPSLVMQVLKQRTSRILSGEALRLWQLRFSRFQRIQRTQVERKTPLHALESSSPRTRFATRGLALEQLPLPCISGARNRHR
jgi:putative transposase